MQKKPLEKIIRRPFFELTRFHVGSGGRRGGKVPCIILTRRGSSETELFMQREAGA